MEKRPHGFTLIELLLVMGILGILAALSIGYGGNFLRELTLKALARNALSAINQGRAEAIRRSTKVSVSFSNSHIYSFIDKNGDYIYDSGDVLIFQYPPASGYGSTPIPSGFTITSNNTNLTTTNPVNAFTLIIDYQGYLEDYQGNPISTILCIKDTNAADKVVDHRAIQVSVSGASRVQGYAQGIALCP